MDIFKPIMFLISAILCVSGAIVVFIFLGVLFTWDDTKTNDSPKEEIEVVAPIEAQEPLVDVEQEPTAESADEEKASDTSTSNDVLKLKDGVTDDFSDIRAKPVENENEEGEPTPRYHRIKADPRDYE